MSNIKVGDRIEVFGDRRGNYTCKSARVVAVDYIGDIVFIGDGYSDENCCHPYDCRLLETKSNNMNIREKFLLSLKNEPEKSFRKAGITNGDDLNDPSKSRKGLIIVEETELNKLLNDLKEAQKMAGIDQAPVPLNVVEYPEEEAEPDF